MWIADNCNSALATMTITKGQDRGDHHLASSNSDLSKKTAKETVICNFGKNSGHIAKYRFARKHMKKNSNAADGQKVNSNSANFSAFIVSKEFEKASGNALAVNRDVAWFCESDERDFWILDRGASRYMCFLREWFTEFVPCGNEYVCLGDETKASVEDRAKIYIKRLVNGIWLNGVINDVLYVPSLRKNLFSAGVCTTNGCVVCFERNSANIFS